MLVEQALAGPDEVDAAVDRAARALPGLAGRRPDGPGPAAAPAWPTAVEEHAEELAQLETANVGKPIALQPVARSARRRTCSTTTPAAVDKHLGDTIPVAGGVAMTFHEPLGVVGADHAVELPAADRRLEARAGAGLRATRWCSSPPS